GSTLSLLSSVMARTFSQARIDEADAPLLARMKPPAWTFIHGPRSPPSSTEVRAGGASRATTTIAGVGTASTPARRSGDAGSSLRPGDIAGIVTQSEGPS